MPRENYLQGATIAERLEFYSMPEPNSGCLLWLARSEVRGYGRLKIDGRHQLTHRLAWCIKHGVIPTGRMVLHRCDVPACINPEHLFLGDASANMRDMTSKGRRYQPNTKGSRQRSAKVTEAVIPAIREDARTYREIGEAYGITPPTVCNIKSRKTWAHVP